MRTLWAILIGTVTMLSLSSCDTQIVSSRVSLACEGEFTIVSYVKTKSECYPKVEIVSSEGGLIQSTFALGHMSIDSQIDGYDIYIHAALKDPCSDAIIQYRVISCKDTVTHTDTIRSLGFQATGPRKTTYNRQTGYFEYELEFGCCPNAPAGQYEVSVKGYGKIDFLKVVPDKITCPTAGGPQRVRVSGFTKDTLYTSVSTSFKGPKRECSIFTNVK